MFEYILLIEVKSGHMQASGAREGGSEGTAMDDGTCLERER